MAANVGNTNGWGALLDELLYEIFSYLPRGALIAAGKANQHWHRVSKDKSLEKWCWLHTARDLGLEALEKPTIWKGVVLANRELGRGNLVEKREFGTQYECFSAYARVGEHVIVSYGTQGVLEQRDIGPEESRKFGQDPSEYKITEIFPSGETTFYTLNLWRELRQWTIEQDGNLNPGEEHLELNYVKDMKMVGNWLISRHENTIRMAHLDDAQAGKLELEVKQRFPMNVGLFYADHEIVAMSQWKREEEKQYFCVFKIQEDRSLTPLHELESHLVDPSKFCRKGNRLVLADHKTFEIWNLADGTRIKTFAVQNHINAFTLAGNTLIISSEGQAGPRKVKMKCLKFIDLEKMKIFYTHPLDVESSANKIDTRGNQVIARAYDRIVTLTFESDQK